jgi:hypothetical protein
VSSRFPLPGRACLGAALAFSFLLGSPGAASADWYVIPGLGLSFAGSTSLIYLNSSANPVGQTRTTYEVSVLWLGEGWVGIDSELGYFSGERGSLSEGGSVLTAMGSIVATIPLSVTRHSLRPYGMGGFGLIRTTGDDIFNATQPNENLLGLRLGGGATGFFSDEVGVRMDLSYFRTLKGQGNESGTAVGSRSLSYWRASAGLVLRF